MLPSSLSFSWDRVSFQFSSVAHSCLTLCNPMNRSTPGLPVHHKLPEFTQTHVHWVSDAIQPSHPLSSPSSPAPNPSQHQSFPASQLFTWCGQSTGVSALASFLPTMAFAKKNKCKYTHSTLTHIPSPVFPRKNPPKWMTHFSYAEGYLCSTDRWVKSVHTLDGETGNSSIFKTLN